MNFSMTRREMVCGSLWALGAMAAGKAAVADGTADRLPAKFRYCLNTSTISGQTVAKLGR